MSAPPTPAPPARPGPGTPLLVRVRLFAGAAAAAGVEETLVDVTPAAGGSPTVGELRTELGRRHPALVPVLEVATVLVDGVAAGDGVRLVAGDLTGAGTTPTVDVLPPFAGG